MVRTKPEFAFYAKIRSEQVALDDVLCRLFIPIKLTDAIEMHFVPTDLQTNLLFDSPIWRFSVQGELKDPAGKTFITVLSDDVLSSGLTTSWYGGDVTESLMIGSPIDLTITQLFHPNSTKGRVQGEFWITPNPLLEPAYLRKQSAIGSVETTVARQFEFMPDSETRFSFQRHQRSYKNDGDDDVTFSELVATFEFDNGNNEGPEIGEMMSKLDDVLLLASFAGRQRCVCLGWASHDSGTYVRKYLRDKSIPDTINKKMRSGREIIELSDFQDFMNTAFPGISRYSEPSALRRAINFVLPGRKETVDGGLMFLYSALEMLVLHFRRVQGLELILPDHSQWRKVRKVLGDHIDSLELPNEDANAKTMMKAKLSELNRVPFNEAFNQFCEYYSIDLEDLWPVTKTDKGVSLSQLRNKLVHGEHFDRRHYRALINAREHVAWTLERMILGILGWPVERSKVSASYLKEMYPHQIWHEDQRALSTF